MIKRNIYSQVGWRSYLDPTNNPRVERFLTMNGSEVFYELVTNIDAAIKQNSSHMMLLVHPHVTSIVIVKREEFAGLLQHSLDYLINIEEYEMCDYVKDVIERNKKNPYKPEKPKKNVIK